MSYIRLEIGGKERGLKFNQLALELYLRNLNEEALESSAMYATVYAGLKGNCYAKKEESEFTFEDVVDWVDELLNANRQADIQTAINAFEETQSFKNLLETFKKKIEKDDEPVKKEEAFFEIHKFAFGCLGWTPYEYYTASPYEFYCASEGYFDKLEQQARMHRLSSYRIHQSLVERPLKITEYWPIKGDPEPETIAPLTDEELQDILKRHKVELKDGGTRVKN